ncbi:SNF2-related protein [Megasphaera elsdenii]|uniref:SNF2-related protein n=1 Tax=Megasphaera elsdenii TaxID=907 RepID=UPI003F56667A
MDGLLRKDDMHYYQKYSVQFIKDHPVAALLLDCGLGKTVITLTAINDLIYDEFSVKKILVVCPLRVCNVWRDEIKHWDHLRNLTCSLVNGTATERRRALQKQADIYIVNRENLVWFYEHCEMSFDMVVLDELSSFKNHQAKRFKAMKAMRPKVKRIVGLTGTPTGNGLMDLWAEFRILDMGERLGRFISQYRNLYFKPDKRNGMVVYSYKPLPGAEEAIYHQIADITVSMKATDYLEMPELVSVVKEVSLSEKEKKRYDELKKSLVLELPGGEVTAANAASLTLKLSQMANGAIYTDDKDVVAIHDRKLDALEDLVESANGKPVLVAYWFKHDKDRIRKRMEARELKEPQDFADWNAGKIPVALIHPASAGHGLNLQQGGSILIWFGPTWSLELYQQTNARLWRQGQADKTVIIQHIVARDTIDERILNVLEHKDGTQAALIEAVKADLGMTEMGNGGIL